MELSAVKHYMNEIYQYKIGEHQYVIKIVTKKNDVKSLTLHYVEKYFREREIPGHEEYVLPMRKVSSTTLFDYYEAIISDVIHVNIPRFGEGDMTMLAVRYYFELKNDEYTIYYGNYKYSSSKPHDTIDMFNLVIHQANRSYFDAPEWAKGATIYQIFPERFAPTDDKYSSDWFNVPMDWRTRTNGTLKGVQQKLDYLSSLGIDAIYFTPIFKSNSSHRYDTVDYMQIDPPLGSEEDFASLVKACHEKGIRVILDMVFNHCSTDFAPFQDLLKNQQNSPYKDWFMVERWPAEVKFPSPYLGFSHAPFMPKLDTDNKDCRAYLLNVASHYLKDFDVDGYRLDVADEVTHSFWKEFRKKVKSIKKDALIMGEVWYESSPYLRGDEFDSIMNYTIFDAIRGFINDKYDVSKFIDIIETERGENPLTYLHNSNILIGSHDTDRIFTDVGSEDKYLCAMSLLYFIPGAPILYYGDEKMMEGKQDPDCRRGMIFDENYNKDSFEKIKRLIHLKHEDVLRKGDIRFEENPSYLHLIRFNDNNQRHLIISLQDHLNLKQYKGIKNLLDDTIFEGTMDKYKIFIF